MLKAYRKSIAALVGTVGTWGLVAAEDDRISLVEWFALAVALGTAGAVWGLRNEDVA